MAFRRGLEPPKSVSRSAGSWKHLDVLKYRKHALPISRDSSRTLKALVQPAARYEGGTGTQRFMELPA